MNEKQEGKENVVDPKQEGKEEVAPSDPPKKRRRKRVPKVCSYVKSRTIIVFTLK